MENVTCVIKDAPESPPCGIEVFTRLTTEYRFDLGEEFSFRLPVCHDHYVALVARYRDEFKDYETTA